MLSIKWDEIPKGYNFVAQDESGEISAYTNEPMQCYNGWLPNSGEYTTIGLQSRNSEWRTTLTKRASIMSFANRTA